MKKKKERKETYEDVWLYILLLVTVVILAEALKTYTFRVMGVNLTYSLLLLPLSYLLVCIIAKKYDYKKAIAAITISTVAFVGFRAIMTYITVKAFSLDRVTAEFGAYVVSQFICLTIYNFLLNNTESPFILVLFNYLFVLIVYYLVYTLMSLNNMSMENYWTGYFITLAIQIVMCTIMTIVDKKTPRGI